MFIAVDENGKRIVAEKGLYRDSRYYCPTCNEEVRLRVGNNNAPHFAHIRRCLDDFTHDMSEWHKGWQMLFPLKNREVVISYENEIHRADVLCYGTVIEFQHSPISESEFIRRNRFYNAAGYKVVWIFDVIELYNGDDATGRFACSGQWESRWGMGAEYVWKHPWRFLGKFFPQYAKDVDIFFHMIPFGDNPKSDNITAYMEKVVWVNANQRTSWGDFRTSYQIRHYSDLLKWLKKRWLKTRNGVTANTSKRRNYQYQVDGKLLEATEFDEFLNQNQPYHIMKVGQRNSPYATGKYGEPKWGCPDPHQKPCIQEGHCVWGCWSCLAIEEVSETLHLVYCKSPLHNDKSYKVKIFKRVYG